MELLRNLKEDAQTADLLDLRQMRTLFFSISLPKEVFVVTRCPIQDVMESDLQMDETRLKYISKSVGSYSNTKRVVVNR